ncbi:Hypothetical_protein [Hexamita inflata]|uniref:Hypothetical_protein n=1 Tax=Hexamita inflata TaxID=28002 RepID=A0AA86QCC2_9EUKA|nr:Hypothetical protein HINF_LOCUS44269 [Hexamita inflata]
MMMITQKTSNAEVQSENEKKKTEVSQKAEPTKNIEEKAPDKTKPKDAQKQKKPPVQKSQDQKTTQLQCGNFMQKDLCKKRFVIWGSVNKFYHQYFKVKR